VKLFNGEAFVLQKWIKGMRIDPTKLRLPERTIKLKVERDPLKNPRLLEEHARALAHTGPFEWPTSVRPHIDDYRRPPPGEEFHPDLI
jgi:hypothetical protein